MPRILTVSGSPSATSRSARVLHHVATTLTMHGHDLDRLDVRELPATALLHADTADELVAKSIRMVQLADGLVIATPVYKAAYSGLLKCWLDLLPQYALQHKAVLPLATGGSLAHALALDYALRPVLQSMAARHVVQGYLIEDRHISSAASDNVSTIHGDALPGLDAVVEAFHAALPGLPADLRFPRAAGTAAP